ncbi:hypothetical protein [Erwinia rhapontici]|jgi:adenylate kinase family enzyme|uniref:hypothetical protein n=1 Tax=Erwinia rhapontici TaxID=55212 RepID=UPI003B9EBD1E
MEINMKRVLVVGCPGSGKSYIAKKLSELTSIPVVHLDQYYWLPGWRRIDNSEWSDIVDNLVSKPTWIMDGNYSGTLAMRLVSADTVIHLDYPTWLCIWRVIRRTMIGWRGNRGNELAPGCEERFDLAFLVFVFNYRKKYRERDLAKMADFPGQLYRFTSPSALTAFVNELRKTMQEKT